MDREANNQEKSSLLSTTTNNNNNNREDRHESPKKPQLATTASNNNNNNSDRVKRDEWSEGAVSSLLEAYETKWVLRNRAKLKGQDWEDVAKHVSARANSTKSSKTQTQCKNKIESMKKRYRSESATVDAASSSSWPLYPRLDLLLRGNAPPPPPLPPPPPPPPVVASNPHLLMLEQSLHPQPRPPAQNSHGSNGCDRVVKEDGVGPKLSDQESDKNATETDDSSTPVIYSDKEKLKSKNLGMRKDQKNRKKNQRREKCAISESIRLLAEVVVRSEQARMETMRELERMRAETEAKRGEMDLKRTEIIANTQLEIAKLFAAVSGKGGLDSSLRIGRS